MKPEFLGRLLGNTEKKHYKVMTAEQEFNMSQEADRILFNATQFTEREEFKEMQRAERDVFYNPQTIDSTISPETNRPEQ
jgi:hypothetical protein